VRRHVAGGHDAQVVADEGGHLRILENAGVLAEDRTGVGILDVGLDGHHALAATLVENLVEQLENFQVVGMGKTRTEHAQGLLEHGHEHAARVGLQKCPQRRSADDQHLEGVNQGHELPAREDESAEHAAENNDDANDFYHEINACRA